MKAAEYGNRRQRQSGRAESTMGFVETDSQVSQHRDEKNSRP